jgi:hypothetical protein
MTKLQLFKKRNAHIFAIFRRVKALAYYNSGKIPFTLTTMETEARARTFIVLEPEMTKTFLGCHF